MNKLLVATGNAHKLQEIRQIMEAAGLQGWELVSLAQYPDYQPPEEDGDTFCANAAIKAMAAAEMSGLLTLADDSGLTVDALNGAPGVRSARYADDLGCGHDDCANRAKLLKEMADVPDGQRNAAFVCAAALATPDGGAAFIEGRCCGTIAREEKGSGGFGYDNLFFLPELGKTMAELSEEEKNAMSHRGRAMRKIAAALMDTAKDCNCK